MTEEKAEGSENTETATEGAEDWKSKYEDKRAQYGRIEADYDRARAEAEDLRRKLDAANSKLSEKSEAVKNLTEEHGSKEDLEKLVRDELTGEYQGTIDDLKSKLDQATSALTGYQVKTPAMAEAAKHFTSDSLELIGGLVEQNCRFQDGEIVIMDSEGKVRTSPANGPAHKMTLEEFMGELKTKFPSIAKSDAVSGDMSHGTNVKSSGKHNGQAVTPEQFGRMSESERSDYMKHLVANGRATEIDKLVSFKK